MPELLLILVAFVVYLVGVIATIGYLHRREWSTRYAVPCALLWPVSMPILIVTGLMLMIGITVYALAAGIGND